MAFDYGILLAITAMIGWGFADFFAKIVTDKVGYKTSTVINQIISLAERAACSAMSSSRLPMMSRWWPVIRSMDRIPFFSTRSLLL
ncbi:MAG: hypothetical protein ABSF44_08870 [Candidatus Bathyarchaeia archaeon]